MIGPDVLVSNMKGIFLPIYSGEMVIDIFFITFTCYAPGLSLHCFKNFAQPAIGILQAQD